MKPRILVAVKEVGIDFDLVRSPLFVEGLSFKFISEHLVPFEIYIILC